LHLSTLDGHFLRFRSHGPFRGLVSGAVCGTSGPTLRPKRIRRESARERHACICIAWRISCLTSSICSLTSTAVRCVIRCD
jgi:hypothetical protein